MIPVELEVENFLAYRSPGPLRFDGVHVACLSGPNGAGKSALLEAMTWALWGRGRSHQPDDLIHQGRDEMAVRLTFDHEGARYRVIRQRHAGKRGTSLLELQIWDPESEGWRGLGEGALRETQAKITALLRLDYETFLNSALLAQGRADEFTTKTPSLRKQVLADILGLARWERYEERAKERILETQSALARLEGRRQELEAELGKRAEYQAGLAAALESARMEAERLAEAEKEWADLDRARSEVVRLQKQIDDLTRRIHAGEREMAEDERERAAALARADRSALQKTGTEVAGMLAELAGLDTQLESLRQAHASSSEEAAHLRGVNQTLGPQTEPIKARLALLKEAPEPTCPTCGQPLEEGLRRRLVGELEGEIETRRGAFRDHQNRIRELEARTAELQREVRELDRRAAARAGLEKRQAEVEAALAHADESAALAERIGDRIGRRRQEAEAWQRERDGFEAEAQTWESRLAAASLTRESLERLRLEKRLADERVGGARQQLGALDAAARQREEILAERAGREGELGLDQDLRQAFSKRGVPALIIETAVPELERTANEILAGLTDNRLHVRIETQRETRTGEQRDALDIVISDDLGSRPYELYSGGEAFRINFAIRIALSRLLARRAGAQLRSLFIDEGFGTQDASGREQLVAAIQRIQSDFDRILVITHIEEMKEAFPVRIEVEKTPQGSRFRYA